MAPAIVYAAAPAYGNNGAAIYVLWVYSEAPNA
jgi:hypothetical protein